MGWRRWPYYGGVESFYSEEDPTSTTGQTLTQIFGAILANLTIQGQGVIPAGENSLGAFSNGNSATSQSIAAFLSDNASELTSAKPQGFLIYIFFDHNLEIKSQFSGLVQVGDANALHNLQMQLTHAPEQMVIFTRPFGAHMQRIIPV